MTRVVSLARFLWDFVIGDDPRIAAWVTLALLVTLLLSDGGVSAWWLLPLVVLTVLSQSVLKVAAERRRAR